MLKRVHRQRRHLVATIAAAVAGSLLVLTPAASTKADTERDATKADLEANAWQLGTLNLRGIDKSFSIFADGIAYLRFQNGEVEGRTVCGRFAGHYRLVGNKITTSATWTQISDRCRPDVALNARYILSALNGQSALRVVDVYGNALLDMNDIDQPNTELSFSPWRPGLDFSELEGTFWKLSKIQDDTERSFRSAVEIDTNEMVISDSGDYVTQYYRYTPNGFDFPSGGVTSYGIFYGITGPSAEISSFAQNLLKMDTYSVSAESLTLRDHVGKPLIELKRIHSTGAEYRIWHISRYLKNGELVAAVPGWHGEIIFLNGAVLGHPGCGWITIGSKYTLSGSAMNLATGAMVRGPCTPDAEVQLGSVMTALNGPRQVKIMGDKLLLTDDRGAPQLELEESSSPVPVGD